MTDLSKRSVSALRKEAKKKGLKSPEALKKKELIAFLSDQPDEKRVADAPPPEVHSAQEETAPQTMESEQAPEYVSVTLFEKLVGAVQKMQMEISALQKSASGIGGVGIYADFIGDAYCPECGVMLQKPSQTGLGPRQFFHAHRESTTTNKPCPYKGRRFTAGKVFLRMVADPRRDQPVSPSPQLVAEDSKDFKRVG